MNSAVSSANHTAAHEQKTTVGYPHCHQRNQTMLRITMLESSILGAVACCCVFPVCVAGTMSTKMASPQRIHKASLEKPTRGELVENAEQLQSSEIIRSQQLSEGLNRENGGYDGGGRNRSDCLHDSSYELRVITSNHRFAASPSPIFRLFFQGGQETGRLALFPRLAFVGDTLQTFPLYLSRRPESMEIIGTGQSYGYSEILLIHGEEVTTILPPEINMNPDPLIINVTHWVRGGPPNNVFEQQIPMSNTFPVPPPAAGDTSTPSRQPSPGNYLELVTSNVEYAHTLSAHQMTVQVSDGRNSGSSITVLSPREAANAFDCRSVNFDWHSAVEIAASGPGMESWGWRAVYFVNVLSDQVSVTPLVDSINGIARGLNNMWIGVPSGDVVQGSVQFALPTTTSTTTVTTTITVTSTTTSTTSTMTTNTNTPLRADPSAIEIEIDTPLTWQWRHRCLTISPSVCVAPTCIP